jgi:DNA-binding transcriptional regulator YiaG
MLTRASQTPVSFAGIPYPARSKTFSNLEPSIRVMAQPALTLEQRIETVRGNLGTSITGLSDLFGVTRASIYNWFNNVHEITDKHLEMLERLEHRSTLWTQHADHQSGLVISLGQKIDGQTMLQWLTQPDLDDTALTAVFDALIPIATRQLKRNKRTHSSTPNDALEVVRPEPKS